MKKIITYILLVLLGTLSTWSQIPSQAVKDLKSYELKTIRGLVIDDLDFEPVPLVDIMIDDSVKIASTQLNGFFSILGPDTIKSLSFRAVGFEPMKVELCDDDYLEVIMISTSSDCFLTKDEAKKKTQKRFKQLGKLRKEALKRGIFQNKKPCYKQIFVP